MFTRMAQDPDKTCILWRHPCQWDDGTVRRFLSRRERAPLNDPRCTGITHFKRVGKNALYEFHCLLQKSGTIEGMSHGFWVPYLDVLALPEASLHLDVMGWVMHEYFSEYSDGEEVWDSGGDSNDEELARRRKRRGGAHVLQSRRFVRGQKRFHSER